MMHLKQGSPNFRLRTSTCCQVSDDIRLEIKCTIIVMCMNCPTAIPPTPDCGKIVFHEIGPCHLKVGDCCSETLM